MENLKHTKGEWTNTGLEIRGENSMILATVYKHLEVNQSEEEALANAKLIAAAPDLLEALKVCYNSLCTYGSHPIIENQVEKAIEKATK